MCITVQPTLIALKLNIFQNELKDLEAAEILQQIFLEYRHAMK